MSRKARTANNQIAAGFLGVSRFEFALIDAFLLPFESKS